MDYDVIFFLTFIYLFMDFNEYLKIESGVVRLVFILCNCPKFCQCLNT